MRDPRIDDGASDPFPGGRQILERVQPQEDEELLPAEPVDGILGSDPLDRPETGASSDGQVLALTDAGQQGSRSTRPARRCIRPRGAHPGRELRR